MPSSLRERHSNALLLKLLNLLSDFDGEMSETAVVILDELRQRSDTVPHLYADVFRLPVGATCADLVQRIESLSQEQVATVSYAFQIFHSYERMLRVDTTKVTPQQQAASESQLERLRLLIAHTKTVLAEAFGEQQRKG